MILNILLQSRHGLGIFCHRENIRQKPIIIPTSDFNFKRPKRDLVKELHASNSKIKIMKENSFEKCTAFLEGA